MPAKKTNVKKSIHVSTQDAKQLAERSWPQSDPFPKIPASLLSEQDIVHYVSKTGFISPFHEDKNESRLKIASYEGRIGSKVLLYNEIGQLAEQKFSHGTYYKFPANSIVFVECDLEFRLPKYIAARFNLQIRHVHRGLLLGTGPLVDPDYWGKLCIPLHNLTSEDYYISTQDGLIWVEFTKTSPLADKPSEKTGEHPTGHWDIVDFITKAGHGNGNGNAVPIRSSIPVAIDQALKSAEEASKASTGAAKLAQESKDFVRNLGLTAAFIALITTLTTLFFLINDTRSFWASLQQIYSQQIGERGDQVDARLDNIEAVQKDQITGIAEVQQELSIARQKTDSLEKSQKELLDELRKISRNLNQKIQDSAK